MNATLINSFPPVHSYDSPRSWFLAGIIVLHVGFFWALSNGLIVKVIPKKLVQTEFVTIDQEPQTQPPRPVEVKPFTGVEIHVPTPPEEVIIETQTQESSAPTGGSSDLTPLSQTGSGPALPVIAEPRMDLRYFSEPSYPPAAIRAGHEGTVVLALEVLSNGHVGEVRVQRSSGYRSLDQSALREARGWRFKPGTSDGRALTMWKEVPVTFELKEKSR